MQKAQSGQQVHIEQHGNKGQDLVLLHGWGLNSSVWTPLVERLSDHYCLHLVDLPGFGYSPPLSAEEFTLSRLAKIVTEAVPVGASWAGWSMGGLVAQQAAVNGQAARLMLIGSSPKFVSSGQWQGIQPAILNQFSRQLQQDTGKTLQRFLAIQAMGSDSARKDVKQISAAVATRPLPSQQTLAKGLALLNEVDLRCQLANLGVPVSLLFGRLDTLVPAGAVEDIAQCFHSPMVEIIEHASHAPFISHPDQVASAINAWMNQD